MTRRGSSTAVAVVAGMLACSEGALTSSSTETVDGSSETASETTPGSSSVSGGSSGSNSTSSSTTQDSQEGDASGGDAGGAESSGGVGLCGDGSVDPGEDCDDGNDVAADGCNPDCVESGRILWTHLHAAGLGDTEVFRGVSLDDRGGVVAVGSVPGTTGRDIFVRRYSTAGALEWTATIDGPAASEDDAFAVATGTDGSFVAGTVRNLVDDDGWLARLDAEGGVVWSIFEDSGLGFDGLRGVDRTPDGGAVVAGYRTVIEFMDTTQTISGLDVFVRKYDADGGVVWTQEFGGAALSNDLAEAVAVDDEGNVAAIGWETLDGGTRDIWLRKFDPSGNPLWTRTQGGAAGLDDQGRGISFGPGGVVVAVGFEAVDAERQQWWVRTYDGDGNEAWTHRDLGVTLEGMQALGVTVDLLGDVVVTGTMVAGTGQRLIVRKYAPDGEVRWTRDVEGAVGTTQVGLAVAVATDASIFAVGGFDIGVDGRDAWIGRLAP